MAVVTGVVLVEPLMVLLVVERGALVGLPSLMTAMRGELVVSVPFASLWGVGCEVGRSVGEAPRRP